MFDIVPNRLLDALCIIIVILVTCYNFLCMQRGKKGTGYVFFVVLVLLFSLYYRPIEGDYWHYYEVYQLGPNYSFHSMESFYLWLMGIIPHNYTLWRICIWLPAAILVAGVFSLFRIQSCYATTFFLLLGLSAFYYTRNVLALSFLYLGMAFITLRGGITARFGYAFFFLALALLSWYLHKSMPLYIGIALLAIVLPFDKKYFIAALIAFPLLYGILSVLASDFLNITEIWLTSDVGENYLEAENDFFVNWKGAIRMAIKFAPFVYFYIIAFRKPLPKDSNDFFPYKVFLLFSFFVFYVSFLFLGQGSASIQSRLFRSSLIPFSFVVALYFKHNIRSKQCNVFIYLLLFYYSVEGFFAIAS